MGKHVKQIRTVGVHDETYARLKNYKDASGVSLTKIIEFAVKEYLDARDAAAGAEALDRR